MLTPAGDEITGHSDLTAEHQQPSAIFDETFHHPMTSPFSVPQAVPSTTPTLFSEAPHRSLCNQMSTMAKSKTPRDLNLLI